MKRRYDSLSSSLLAPALLAASPLFWVAVLVLLLSTYGCYGGRVGVIEQRLDLTEATAAAHSDRLNDLTTTAVSHNKRLVDVEATVADHGDRLTAAEAKISELETWLTGLEPRLSANEARISATANALEDLRSLERRRAVSFTATALSALRPDKYPTPEAAKKRAGEIISTGWKKLGEDLNAAELRSFIGAVVAPMIPAAPAPAASAPAASGGTPPAGTPPAGTPPAGTPPAGTPPAGTPPASAAPAPTGTSSGTP